MKKRFYIQTLGCKVNQYESQLIREGLLRGGCVEAVGVDDADVFIVNTCTVTSTSDSKSLRLIRSGVKKQKNVVVTGCVVEDKDLDLRKLSGVHFIVRNRDKYKIPQLIDPKYEIRNTEYGIRVSCPGPVQKKQLLG